ncbi:MAG: thiolase family protein [Deltaproteobacteria bacterium]|nr:thiolase family protein [Deltaproteobacteria bacterium]
MGNPSGKCAIVGMGETVVGKRPDATTNSLHLEAIKASLDDAGIKASQVDGLLTNQPLNDSHRSYAVKLASMAGIDPLFATDLALGGATPIAMVQHAVLAIEAGMATTVVCVHARKRSTADPTPGHPIRRGDEHWEEPWGHFSAAGGHAFAASRHMYEFGTKSEDLAEIAISTRKHASLNKNATMRKPITLEDHQNSRMICAPLRLLDCSLESDGGGAVVVTSAEHAKDFPKKPVLILGLGQHHPHSSLMNAATLTTLGGKKSSELAYKMAGLKPKDMHFAQLYDCFTITSMITLEDYGFCKKGEGKDFVKNGRITIGGEIPLNTHGGLLSQAHLEGQLHITEAVKQLRGNEVEPERQVKDAKVGIVSGHGGSLAMHATMILGVQ